MTSVDPILVTGANGFLGRALVARLLSSGASVRATDLGAAGSASGAAYRQADITRPEELPPLMENVTVAIHAAGLAHVMSPDAQSAGRFELVNETGTASIAAAAAAAGVRHLVLISSVSVYGPSTRGMCDENTPCNPDGPYAISKHRAEQQAIDIAGRSGMALTTLRLATLYGEGDPGNVGRLMRAVDGRRFLWIGDGSNRKSLLYSEDAARACLAVAERPASGISVYNVSAPPCTMREIVSAIAGALGKSVPAWHVPAAVALSAAKFAGIFSFSRSGRLGRIYGTLQKWLAEDCYATEKFCTAFNFQTKVSLQEGLKREAGWYKAGR
ncbi:NAD-dependent epimerase/dehydratase family protein [Thermodesulfobacteriota bacterium]